MNLGLNKQLLIFLVMLLAGGLAYALKPTQKSADQGPKIDLETLIPQTFNGWILDNSITPLVANPTQEAMLDQLYSQILSRTYIHPNGARIMLSLAYGAEQSRQVQVHRPETCYPAQGFQLTAKTKEAVATAYGHLPVMRLVAVQGQRQEPITYWIRVGDKLVRGNLELGFARLSFGIVGKIPDGLLVRVSSLSKDPGAAYQNHDRFIADLLTAVDPADRPSLIGIKPWVPRLRIPYPASGLRPSRSNLVVM